MAEAENKIRLSKVKGEFNVSLDRIFEYLDEQGHKLERNPNGKISEEQYKLLLKEFAQDREEKEESKQVGISRTKKDSVVQEETPITKAQQRERDRDQEEVLIKDMNSGSSKTTAQAPKEKIKKEKPVEEIVRTKAESPVHLKVVDKIDIEESKPKSKKKKADSESKTEEKKTEKKPASKKKKEEEPVVEIPVVEPCLLYTSP